MTTIEKLKDLVFQATKERSHYYVKSVAEESIQRIEKLEAALRFYADKDNWIEEDFHPSPSENRTRISAWKSSRCSVSY